MNRFVDVSHERLECIMRNWSDVLSASQYDQMGMQMGIDLHIKLRSNPILSPKVCNKALKQCCV